MKKHPQTSGTNRPSQEMASFHVCEVRGSFSWARIAAGELSLPAPLPRFPTFPSPQAGLRGLGFLLHQGHLQEPGSGRFPPGARAQASAGPCCTEAASQHTGRLWCGERGGGGSGGLPKRPPRAATTGPTFAFFKASQGLQGFLWRNHCPRPPTSDIPHPQILLRGRSQGSESWRWPGNSVLW